MALAALNACYGSAAGEYLDHGLAPFPVATQNKRPAVKGWQKAKPALSRRWADSERLASQDGIGINLGPSSRIVEVDVDQPGGAFLKEAIEIFGESPVVIRTASGKHKLWYRHSGEGRHIRPFANLEIDLLGAGFTIAPPSFRSDLGTVYHFVRGSLNDLERLPPIRPGALDDLRHSPSPARSSVHRSSAVPVGQRNNTLWLWAMEQARHCDDEAALIDCCLSWASAMADPLPKREVEACARSAWQYEITGRNFVGLRKPQISQEERCMDLLIDQPEAYMLHQLFARWHRNGQSFAIAPTAMEKARNPPWPRRRIEKARDVLLERGLLIQLKAPVRGHRPGLYRLSGEIGKSAKDHSTPSPLSLPLRTDKLI